MSGPAAPHGREASGLCQLASFRPARPHASRLPGGPVGARCPGDPVQRLALAGQGCGRSRKGLGCTVKADVAWMAEVTRKTILK